MTAHGAASAPAPGERHDQTVVPDLDQLRVVLRGPDLPLPAPRTVSAAADRVMDLIHADRAGDARVLAERFRSDGAAVADRLALLRARLLALSLTGGAQEIQQAAHDLIALLREAGHQAQADATATVLVERGPLGGRRPGPDGAVGGPRPGRRRGRAAEVSAPLLSVVRGLEYATLTAPGGTGIDPTDPVGGGRVLTASLDALPEVADQLLGDAEPVLRLRLAQALESGGRAEAATTQALDVLELLDRGPTEHPRERTGSRADPQRLATAAHAVLARTLCASHPLVAVHHALDALATLHDVDDPPLRIGVITDLLNALVHAGLEDQASFTAGRLISLQRTLRRDGLRTRPLLAVAAQRIRAERYDAARVPLDQVRRIAGEQRDRHASLEAARLATILHERTGDPWAALRSLRRVAADARRLADDLATPSDGRGPLVRTELEAQALVMRRAMDLQQWSVARTAAEEIRRRTRPEGGRAPLPASLLWDHRVDATVAMFLMTGAALLRGEGGASPAGYQAARREAMLAIDEAPDGHDARARYWATYLEDRHAAMLADRGQRDRALRAARRAREGWQHLEAADDMDRMDALIADLEQG